MQVQCQVACLLHFFDVHGRESIRMHVCMCACVSENGKSRDSREAVKPSQQAAIVRKNGLM